MSTGTLTSQFYPNGMRTLLFAIDGEVSPMTEDDWIEFTLTDPLPGAKNAIIKGRLETYGVRVTNADRVEAQLYSNEYEARHRLLKMKGKQVDLGFESQFSVVVLTLVDEMFDGGLIGSVKLRHLPFNKSMLGGVAFFNEYNENISVAYGDDDATIAPGQWQYLAPATFKYPDRDKKPPDVYTPEDTVFVPLTVTLPDGLLVVDQIRSVDPMQFVVEFMRGQNDDMIHDDHNHKQTSIRSSANFFFSFTPSHPYGFSSMGFFWSYFTPYFNSKLATWPKA